MLAGRAIGRNQMLNFVFVAALISCAQGAHAAHEHRAGFHEFKAQNARIDRHMARRMFKEQMHARGADADWRGKHGVAGGALPFQGKPAPELPRHPKFGPSYQFNDHARLVRLESGIDLNLNSDEKNIVLGPKLFSKIESVQIEVGNETRRLSAGARVTAAEYIAVKQVLGGMSQSVSLNNNGQATGGEVDLALLTDKSDVMRAENLVVPANVTALGDFGKGSDFRLLGDLDNFGTVQAFASIGRGRGVISADNITNHSDALVTSTVDLALLSKGNLTNHGTITSAENLSLKSQDLNNDGKISAAKHIDVNAFNIHNGGEVTSHAGNINIDVPQGNFDSGTLNIDNNSGTLNAQSGAINIRAQSYAGLQDTNLYGGNILCQELNLNSGNGLTSVNVDQLTGTVNSTGLAAHIMADTEELVLGKTCLIGDPTFFNTAGDVAINGGILVGEALTIVAFGDININNGSDLQSGDNTSGYPMTLIAGASFTNAGGANQATIGPIPPLNPNNGSVTINGGSATGGAIHINSAIGSETIIRTRPTGQTGPGGDFTMVAFAGTAPGSGRITTGADVDSILTGGKGNFTNGNITIIAPEVSNSTSSLPTLDTIGGTSGGGNITITAAAPVANAVTYAADGSLTAGQIVPSSSLSAIGQIRFGGVVAGSGTVTARANLVQQTPGEFMSARRIEFEGNTINILGNLNASSLFTATSTGALRTTVGGTLGQVNSPISILTSTTGDIGAPGLEFLVTGGTIFADSASGVRINSTTGINIAGGSVDIGSFVVAANGNTTITGNVSVNTGSIDISTTSGALSAGAVNLETDSGNINLANLNVDKKTSKVTLTGTNITALGSPGFGDITISVGTPVAPVAGKTPRKNVTIDIQGTGQMFFGSKGITTNAPGNSLTAKNADLIFKNELSRKNIVLSGVTLVADPD